MNARFIPPFLLFCAFVCPLIVCGQTDTILADTATELSFVAYWSVGDSFRYEVTEINVSYSGDSITVNDTVRYEADFVVVDSTADSYSVVWDIHKDASEEYEAFLEAAGDEYQHLLDSLGDVRPRFRTDELGVYEGLDNLEPLLRSLEVLGPPMMEYRLSQDSLGMAFDERQRKIFARFAAKKMVKETTAASVTEEFLSVVPYFLFPLGAVYPLYDTTEVMINLPTNVPDREVLHHVKYYFDDYLPEDGYVHMKVISQVDDADGPLVVAESLRLKGFPEDVIEDFVQNGYYREREDNDFYYYYEYGVPEAIDCYREIVVEARDEKRVVNITHILINMIFTDEDEGDGEQ